MNLEKRKKLKTIILLLVITNICIYLLTVSGVLAVGHNYVFSTADANTAQDVNKFIKLKNIIDKNFYQDVDDDKMMESVYKAMFSSLGDTYSQYYNEEQYQTEIEDSTGSYGGCGIVIMEDDQKNIVVESIFSDSPAEKAGLQVGDKIVKVEGEDMNNKGLEYASSKLRGDEGTDVTVTIERNGQEMDITMTREIINYDTVSSKVIDNSIGYIDIVEFTDSTSEDFNEQLNSLEKQGVKSIIIDLRYNGGGLVSSATDIADRLLGDAEIVYTVEKDGTREDYKSTSDESFDGEIVVLVNGDTASASEILAGALQDNKKATLVGTQTFGKGIVQTIAGLPDGTGYKLTTAQYFTPNGRNIHKKGLTPDVVVEQNEQYKDSISVPESEDTQLQKALEILKTQ